MRVLYLHNTGQQAELLLDELIEDFHDRDGWHLNTEDELRAMLARQGWFEGAHEETGPYPVLDLARLGLRSVPRLVVRPDG
jgi:hypothetical protein